MMTIAVTITTREIAALTGKTNAKVMRDVRWMLDALHLRLGSMGEYVHLPYDDGSMHCLPEDVALPFAGTYRDANGQPRPCYCLSEDVALELLFWRDYGSQAEQDVKDYFRAMKAIIDRHDCVQAALVCPSASPRQPRFF